MEHNKIINLKQRQKVLTGNNLGMGVNWSVHDLITSTSVMTFQCAHLKNWEWLQNNNSWMIIKSIKSQALPIQYDCR